jgi:hypothetical protein
VLAGGKSFNFLLAGSLPPFPSLLLALPEEGTIGKKEMSCFRSSSPSNQMSYCMGPDQFAMLERLSYSWCQADVQSRFAAGGSITCPYIKKASRKELKI